MGFILANGSQSNNSGVPSVAFDPMHNEAITARYLRLGLAFDRLEEGFVDAFTGDPALRREVENAPAPDPRDLAHQAASLRDELPGAGLGDIRTEFVDSALRALECSARKFAGDDIGFVEEVHNYFDVDITMGDPDTYRSAHAELDELLPGTGDLAERYACLLYTSPSPRD